jgi:hypothetical protein
MQNNTQMIWCRGVYVSSQWGDRHGDGIFFFSTHPLLLFCARTGHASPELGAFVLNHHLACCWGLRTKININAYTQTNTHTCM